MLCFTCGDTRLHSLWFAFGLINSFLMREEIWANPRLSITGPVLIYAGYLLLPYWARDVKTWLLRLFVIGLDQFVIR